MMGVYLCRDASGEVIYVGQSIDVAERLNNHRRSAPWWTEVADFDVEVMTNRGLLRGRERELIEQHQPRHNVFLTERNRERHLALIKYASQEAARMRAARSGAA